MKVSRMLAVKTTMTKGRVSMCTTTQAKVLSTQARLVATVTKTPHPDLLLVRHHHHQHRHGNPRRHQKGLWRLCWP